MLGLLGGPRLQGLQRFAGERDVRRGPVEEQLGKQLRVEDPAGGSGVGLDGALEVVQVARFTRFRGILRRRQHTHRITVIILCVCSGHPRG